MKNGYGLTLIEIGQWSNVKKEKWRRKKKKLNNKLTRQRIHIYFRIQHFFIRRHGKVKQLNSLKSIEFCCTELILNWFLLVLQKTLLKKKKWFKPLNYFYASLYQRWWFKIHTTTIFWQPSNRLETHFFVVVYAN